MNYNSQIPLKGWGGASEGVPTPPRRDRRGLPRRIARSRAAAVLQEG